MIAQPKLQRKIGTMHCSSHHSQSEPDLRLLLETLPSLPIAFLHNPPLQYLPDGISWCTQQGSAFHATFSTKRTSAFDQLCLRFHLPPRSPQSLRCATSPSMTASLHICSLQILSYSLFLLDTYHIPEFYITYLL